MAWWCRRELKFTTVGDEIYFQHPDGSWEGDRRPDQIVLAEVIHLDPLRLRIDKAARRSSDDAGRVEKRRGVHASAPVFAGTRILLDHDVDAAVGRMLRHRGHECWTAGSAGLARAKDDELTVWAVEHQAVLVSTDTEFSQRRMQNSIGRHVWLNCP